MTHIVELRIISLKSAKTFPSRFSLKSVHIASFVLFHCDPISPTDALVFLKHGAWYVKIISSRSHHVLFLERSYRTSTPTNLCGSSPEVHFSDRLVPRCWPDFPAHYIRTPLSRDRICRSMHFGLFLPGAGEYHSGYKSLHLNNAI